MRCIEWAKLQTRNCITWPDLARVRAAVVRQRLRFLSYHHIHPKSQLFKHLQVMSAMTPPQLQAPAKQTWAQFINPHRWNRVLARHSSTSAWKTSAAERASARERYLSSLTPSFRYFAALPRELQLEIIEYLDCHDLKRLEYVGVMRREPTHQADIASSKHSGWSA